MGSRAFGAWLKQRLGVRPYGQCAAYVGVSTSTVSRWSTGASAPEYRNRLRLAAYLGVEPSVVEAFFPDEVTLHAQRAGPAFVVSTRTTTVRVEDPLLERAFYGFLQRWPTLTDAQKAALAADERDIPEPPADAGGDGDAGGGGPGARDPGGARH